MKDLNEISQSHYDDCVKYINELVPSDMQEVVIYALDDLVGSLIIDYFDTGWEAGYASGRRFMEK